MLINKLRKISSVNIGENYTLKITTDDGRKGNFDVKPYLNCEAFQSLKNIDSFKKIVNGGYYIEWECGADLSSDTIEAYLQI